MFAKDLIYFWDNGAAVPEFMLVKQLTKELVSLINYIYVLTDSWRCFGQNNRSIVQIHQKGNIHKIFQQLY